MIISFGYVGLEINIDLDDHNAEAAHIYADHYGIDIGGKAAMQAVAATRAGAKITLVGAIGSHDSSDFILNKIKNAGLKTDHIKKTSAALPLYIKTKKGQDIAQDIIVPAAGKEISAKDLPEEALDKKNILLLQTEISMDVNEQVLELAKKAGMKTVLNLAPSIDASQKALDLTDTLIVNREEAGKLAQKLGINHEDDAIKLAEGFSKQGNLDCIITIGARGCVAYSAKGEAWSVDALPIENLVDRSGAEDAYCGALAACLDAGMPLPRAIKRASIAGSLACTRSGTVASFPTIEEIDARINDLEDPVNHSAE